MPSRRSFVLILFAAFAVALVATGAWAQGAEQVASQGPKPAPQAPMPAGTSPAPVVPAPAPAKAPPPKDWNTNVRVDVTIADITNKVVSTLKSISVTVRNDGRGSVRSGVSLPIPSTTFAAVAQGGVATNPMTSWQYKDVGLSLDVTSVVISDNFVRLRLAVEYNPVDEKTASVEGANALPPGQNMASFSQFRQNLDLVLESGKSLVVATSSDPVPGRDRKASLEVKATILR
jgi:hypothetical protein